MKEKMADGRSWLAKQDAARWVLAAIVVVALVLRLPLLGGSFWLDEAAQALESVRPLSQQLQIVDDFQPPLLHIWIHFLTLFGYEEWWLRLGAALAPGVLTVVVVALIGARLRNWRVGVLAALLLATSSFHIFYSQELRPYALPALWAVLSWWMLIEWKQSVILSERSESKDLASKEIPRFASLTRNDIIIWSLISLAGWYTSYLYPFLWLSQLVWLGIVLWPQRRQRKVWGPVVLSAAATVAGFVPWLPLFLQQLHAGQTLRVTLPGWQSVVSFDQVKSLALTVGKFAFGVISLKPSLPVAALVLLAGLVGMALLKGFLAQPRAAQRKALTTLVLPAIWLVLPILFAWLVSFVVPVLQPKRVLFALPAAYLLMAMVIDELLPEQVRLQDFWACFLEPRLKSEAPGTIRHNVWKAFLSSADSRPRVGGEKYAQKSYLGIVVIAALIFINLFGTLSYYRQPQYQREDWRSLHQQILQWYPQQAVAVFAFPEAFAPWRWYDDGKYPVVVTGELTTDSAPRIDRLRAVTNYQTVLVFDYLRDLTDPQHKIDQQLREYGYTEVQQITPATPIGQVHVWVIKTHTLTQR